MRLLPPILSLLLIATLNAFSTLKEVTPLQTEAGSNFCTSFSINEKLHLFVTAAHCVDEFEPDLPVPHLYRMRIRLLLFDKESDIAVIRGPVSVKALHFQNDAPTLGQEVMVVGYPYGGDQALGFGRLSVLHQKVEKSGIKTIFAVMGAAPGNSGSPIMNTRREVISVLQQGWPDGGFVGGTPWEILVRLLQPFME